MTGGEELDLRRWLTVCLNKIRYERWRGKGWARWRREYWRTWAALRGA